MERSTIEGSHALLNFLCRLSPCIPSAVAFKIAGYVSPMLCAMEYVRKSEDVGLYYIQENGLPPPRACQCKACISRAVYSGASLFRRVNLYTSLWSRQGDLEDAVAQIIGPHPQLPATREETAAGRDYLEFVLCVEYSRNTCYKCGLGYTGAFVNVCSSCGADSLFISFRWTSLINVARLCVAHLVAAHLVGIKLG